MKTWRVGDRGASGHKEAGCEFYAEILNMQKGGDGINLAVFWYCLKFMFNGNITREQGVKYENI